MKHVKLYESWEDDEQRLARQEHRIQQELDHPPTKDAQMSFTTDEESWCIHAYGHNGKGALKPQVEAAFKEANVPFTVKEPNTIVVKADDAEAAKSALKTKGITS